MLCILQALFLIKSLQQGRKWETACTWYCLYFLHRPQVCAQTSSKRYLRKQCSPRCKTLSTASPLCLAKDRPATSRTNSTPFETSWYIWDLESRLWWILLLINVSSMRFLGTFRAKFANRTTILIYCNVWRHQIFPQVLSALTCKSRGCVFLILKELASN